MTRTSITPGKVWLDTDGNRIQAHGGSPEPNPLRSSLKERNHR